MKETLKRRAEADSFPTTMHMGSKDFYAYSKEAYDHLREDENNTVLITHYNKPQFVLLNADTYLQLIRE